MYSALVEFLKPGDPGELSTACLMTPACRGHNRKCRKSEVFCPLWNTRFVVALGADDSLDWSPCSVLLTEVQAKRRIRQHCQK